MEQVILVDDEDIEIGVMEKMAAHREGKLHRALSVFIFNNKNEFLLQQRAFTKYHSGGLWTNTCCTHPMPGEDNLIAANRRLFEEMGMECQLKHSFSFIYYAKLDNALIEHELDHVFVGYSDTIPQPNSSEVADYKYISKNNLLDDIKVHPENYTEWFKICLPTILKKVEF